MTKRQYTSSIDKGNFFRLNIIGLVAGMAALLVLVYKFNFIQDDAFISFRYAANCAAGHGLVYNIGERVEGYTNFLWTVFMVLGRQTGFDLVVFSQILGTLFGLITIVFCYRLSRLVFTGTPDPWRTTLPGVSCLFLGLTLSFAYWTVSGLETAAFSCMIVASLDSYLRRSYLAAPALVLATLFRPEGGLVWLFILAYEIISSRSLTHYALVIGGIYVLYLFPLAVFKLTYYGGLVPNPFYAKTTFTWKQIVNGLEYTRQFGFHYLGAGLFVVPSVLAYRKANWAVRLVLIFLLMYVLYIILIGGDVLKVHRFFVPLIPLLLPIILYGYLKILRKSSHIIIGLAILLGWQMIIPQTHILTFHDKERDLVLSMGRLIENLSQEDHTEFSMAASTIGIVGYKLLGHHVLDLLGLTDSTIARHPEPTIEGMETSWRESKFNSRYILSRQPDYILFSTGFKPSAPAERSLFLYSTFLRSYRTIGFYFDGHFQDVYKRYYPIMGAIDRDVDRRFVQYFNSSSNLLFISKDYELALAHNDTAVLYSPSPPYPYLYYYRSEIYALLGDQDAAMAALSKALDLDTLMYEANIYMAMLKQSIGEADSARVLQERTLRLAPWLRMAMKIQ